MENKHVSRNRQSTEILIHAICRRNVKTKIRYIWALGHNSRNGQSILFHFLFLLQQYHPLIFTVSDNIYIYILHTFHSDEKINIIVDERKIELKILLIHGKKITVVAESYQFHLKYLRVTNITSYSHLLIKKLKLSWKFLNHHIFS